MKNRSVLAPNWAVTWILRSLQAVQKLLDYLEVDASSFRLGLSQIFFRSGAVAQLEDAREERISGFIGRLQAHCRGYLGRRRLQKLKLQHLAVTCIQRNVRLLMGIRNWSWWRLYTKVQPLLNVHRTEQELRNTEVGSRYTACSKSFCVRCNITFI